MQNFESRKDALVYLTGQILPAILQREGIQIKGRSDGIDTDTPTSIAVDYALAVLDAIEHREDAWAARGRQPCLYCTGGHRRR